MSKISFNSFSGRVYPAGTKRPASDGLLIRPLPAAFIKIANPVGGGYDLRELAPARTLISRANHEE